VSENKVERIMRDLERRPNVHEELIVPRRPERKKHIKERYEDTHTRKTVWFRNDLYQKLDDLVKKGEKRATILNDALEEYFDKYGI
jgi:3-deoxy-D-manno-octulosonic-acid transferase